MIIRIAYNYDTGTKLENSYYCKKKSARFQLENWNAPAQLGLEHFQLGLAQLEKFQLEIITKLNIQAVGLMVCVFSCHLKSIVLDKYVTKLVFSFVLRIETRLIYEKSFLQAPKKLDFLILNKGFIFSTLLYVFDLGF